MACCLFYDRAVSVDVTWVGFSVFICFFIYFIHCLFMGFFGFVGCLDKIFHIFVHFLKCSFNVQVDWPF